MKNKLYSIQFLRFIAVSLVVFAHCFDRINRYAIYNINEITNYNLDIFFKSGVDLFFVISGFIMGYINDKKIKDDNFDIMSFMKNRILRIVPIYWIISLLVLIILICKPSLFYNTTTDYLHTLGSFLFLPIESPEGKYAPILGVGWTLNMEVYFYLILGIVIHLFRRSYLNYIFIFTIISVIIGFLTNRDVSYLYSMITSSLLTEFVLGLIVFKIYSDVSIKHIIKYKYLIILGAFSLLFYPLFNPIEDEFKFFFYGGGYSLLLFYFVCFLSDIKYYKYIIILGDASYSIYLTHYFTISIFYILFNGHFGTLNLLVVIFTAWFLSMFMGYIFYNLIEVKIIKYIKNKRDNKCLIKKYY